MLTRWRMFLGPTAKVSKRNLRGVIEYYEAELAYQADPRCRCPSCSLVPHVLERNHGVLQESALCN
jgi:hypothetical protein